VKARLVKCLPKTAELVSCGTDHHHNIHNELAIAVNSWFDIHKSQLDVTVQAVVLCQLPVFILLYAHMSVILSRTNASFLALYAS
jgi:hypothetical protein